MSQAEVQLQGVRDHWTGTRRCEEWRLREEALLGRFGRLALQWEPKAPRPVSADVRIGLAEREGVIGARVEVHRDGGRREHRAGEAGDPVLQVGRRAGAVHCSAKSRWEVQHEGDPP